MSSRLLDSVRSGSARIVRRLVPRERACGVGLGQVTKAEDAIDNPLPMPDDGHHFAGILI
jgi:hypothetical protein